MDSGFFDHNCSGFFDYNYLWGNFHRMFLFRIIKKVKHFFAFRKYKSSLKSLIILADTLHQVLDIVHIAEIELIKIDEVDLEAVRVMMNNISSAVISIDSSVRKFRFRRNRMRRVGFKL